MKMPGFFLKPSKTSKKRKAQTQSKGVKAARREKAVAEASDDESVISSDGGGDDTASESEEETAQEKKLRLAKEYISQLEQQEKENQGDKDFNRDAVSHRLKEDVLEDAGRLQKFIADQIPFPDASKFKYLKGHSLPITCVEVSEDSKFIYSSSKDGTIIKWDSTSGKRMAKISGVSKREKGVKAHVGQVLCLALSTNQKFLASAGQDMLIHIWNADSLQWIHTFKGHRKMITGLTFRRNKNQLFSASHDRTVKVWNLDEMAYVETLFGHEDAILGVDSLLRDRVVSCGGRDRSVRLWKIPEESQLVFQTSMGSTIDCVCMLNEEYFLSGSDDGSLSIWFVRKKKPITLRTRAHTPTDGTSSETWISSVAALPFTDVAASGSCDGCIKLWKCEKSFRSLMPVHSIPVSGFVNSLKFSPSGSFLVAGLGQEHRLGRWWRFKEAKNQLVIIPLDKKAPDEPT